MANAQRIPGKKGRLPRDPSKPMLRFEDYLIRGAGQAPLAQVPLSEDIDRSSRVADIPMYLNDQLGDCTIAGAGHLFGALAVYAGYPEPLFSDQEITTAYSAVSGYVPGDESTDNGADMGTVLQYLHLTGMPDQTGKLHKVAGYAAISDVTDETLLGTVLNTFGTIYLGINCPESAEQQFQQGVPWTVVPGSPDEGGHCIVQQRRYPSPGPAGADEWWTWGARQHVTFGFVAKYLQEAYVVVSEDWIAANGTSPTGVNLTQLLADMPLAA